jgi:hypothetical protein
MTRSYTCRTGVVLQPTIGDDELQGSRQLVVVVRLVLDAGWRLVHGELVDVDQRSRGRFAGWAELTPVLKRYVDEELRIDRSTAPD